MTATEDEKGMVENKMFDYIDDRFGGRKNGEWEAELSDFERHTRVRTHDTLVWGFE